MRVRASNPTTVVLAVFAAASLALPAVAAAAAVAIPTYAIRPGQGNEQGAVLRDGQVYAAPLNDPRALLPLDLDNLLVTDGALGFIVGVGPQFGGQDEQGLAARQVLVEGLPEPHEITVSGGRVLVTTRGDGGVVAFDPQTQQVEPLVQGIAQPRQVAALPSGVAIIDEGSAVVLAAADGSEPVIVPIDDPRGLAAGAAWVWTCANGADEVVAIDIGTGTPQQLLPLPDPTDVVALPVGAQPDQVEFLLAESGDTDVVAVDPATGSSVPVSEFTQGLPPLPTGFTLSPEVQEQLRAPAAGQPPADEDAEADAPASDGADEPTQEEPVAPAADDAGANDADGLEGVLDEAEEATGVPLWLLLVLLGPFVVFLLWGVIRGRARQGDLRDGEAPVDLAPDGPPTVGTAPPPASSPIEGSGVDVDARATDDVTVTGVSVDMVPEDPCAELRRRCEDARTRCEELTAACDDAIEAAEQAETAARSAADAATAAAAQEALARDRQREAEEALEDASAPPGEGSSISDDEGRITQRDLGLKRAASKAAWSRYRAGEISAGQLEAEWEDLGERDAIDRLREQDEARREERRQAAEEARAAAAAEVEAAAKAAAEAQQAAADAQQAAATAAAARDTTCQEAEEACEEADAACAELAECEQREQERREREAAEAAAAAAAAAAREADDGDGGGGDDGTPPTPGQGGHGGPGPCCPDCLWVGYGYMTAGHSLIAGVEYTTIYLHCASDPSIWMKLECQTLRIGPGLGGEGAAVGAISFGCSPTDAMQGIRSALNGTNFDISLGVPATKLVKQASKSGDVARALKLLRKLGGKKAPPTQLPKADLDALRGAGATLAGSGTGAGKAAGLQAGQQAAQSGQVDGLVLPLGAGVQVGVWHAISTKIWVTGSNLPAGCVGPPGFTRG